MGGRRCGVVVGRVCRRAVGIVNQRPLQLVGNHAQIVAVHVQQAVHAGLDAHRVGRGNKLPISDQPQLVSAGNDQLRVGGGNLGPQQNNARPQPRGVVELQSRVARDSARPAARPP